MSDFVMPSLGADMEAATLTAWHVKPGDAVKRGDVVASVETAKGIIDIEIFADGVIEALLAAPGAEVPVGAVLARYRGTGAAAPTTPAETPAGPAAAPFKPAPPPAAPAAHPAGEAAASGAGAARLRASPAARRRAAELGVDLAAVATRAGEAVTLQDVERAAAHPAPPTAIPAARDMRSLIAETMSRAKREIPHYYLATTIDMRSALRWLERHNATHPVTERLLYGVLLLKAVARAVERFPELNGFWRDGRFTAAKAINVGTVVRLRQGGLVAPALLAANEQPLAALMREFQDVVRRARSGGLRSTELASATITVSSLGEGSVESVYPIIHAPQVAIVGFGAVATRPWCAGNEVIAAPVVTATLSADHRVSDGHGGSSFLMHVAEWLQRPEDL